MIVREFSVSGETPPVMCYGGTMLVNVKNLPNEFTLWKMRFSASRSYGPFKVQIYQRGICEAVDLLAVVNFCVDPNDPCEIVLDVPYKDFDGEGELHMKITNLDGIEKSFFYQFVGRHSVSRIDQLPPMR